MALSLAVLESVPAPIVAPGISSSLNQAFILDLGRPPVPAKLVSQILALKFIQLSELIPENLEAPTTESTFFTIEGGSIVPTTTTSSRKETEISEYSDMGSSGDWSKQDPGHRIRNK